MGGGGKGKIPCAQCFPHLNVVMNSNVQLQDLFLSIHLIKLTHKKAKVFDMALL